MKIENSTRGKVEGGVWLFILGDISVFSLMLILYFREFTLSFEVFHYSQQLLNSKIAFFNTLLLLLSSWSLVHYHQYRKVRSLQLTIEMGLVFIVSKVAEYNEKFTEGVSILSNNFFQYYFAITATHLFHLIVGLMLLIYALYKRESISTSTENSTFIYWHMVDAIWLLIFPMLYIIQPQEVALP